MKPKRMSRVVWVGLAIFSFFLAGFVVDLRPQPVLEKEVVFSQAAHFNNRGVALYQQGQLQEALANFIIAAELDDTFWQGHYNCSVALIATGNLKEALHHLEMSLEIDPENPIALRLYEDLFWKVNARA